MKAERKTESDEMADDGDDGSVALLRLPAVVITSPAGTSSEQVRDEIRSANGNHMMMIDDTGMLRALQAQNSSKIEATVATSKTHNDRPVILLVRVRVKM